MQKLQAEVQTLKREQLVVEPLRQSQLELEEQCKVLERKFADDRRELLKQNEYLQEQNVKTTKCFGFVEERMRCVQKRQYEQSIGYN